MNIEAIAGNHEVVTIALIFLWSLVLVMLATRLALEDMLDARSPK